MGYFLVVFPFRLGIFFPDHFGIVHIFGLYWTFLNMVVSDYSFHFLAHGKSQDVMYLLRFYSALGLSLAKNFPVFRGSVKEYYILLWRFIVMYA